MPALLIQSLLTGIVAFLCVLLLIALSNWRALRRLPSYVNDGDWPAVSILLPTRNEELTLQMIEAENHNRELQRKIEKQDERIEDDAKAGPADRPNPEVMARAKRRSFTGEY